MENPETLATLGGRHITKTGKKKKKKRTHNTENPKE
jgi:hypothetical protein